MFLVVVVGAIVISFFAVTREIVKIASLLGEYNIIADLAGSFYGHV